MTAFSQVLNDYPHIQCVFRETVTLEQPFEQLARSFSTDKGTVLLLSGPSSDASKYHILGVDPWLEVTSRQETIRLNFQGQEQTIHGDVFQVLSALTDRFRLTGNWFDLPVHAGLFGYFSYDLKDRIETLPITCADTGLPDICLFAPSLILVQDIQNNETSLMIPVLDGNTLADEYVAHKKHLFFERLKTENRCSEFYVDSQGFQSSFTKQEYLAAVETIIDYLKAGDIYQANLSQRFETGFSGDPYSLFLDLYGRNPAAFFSYIHAGTHHIVSTSPERFIRQRGRCVETRPIKGTIARGKTEGQDQANREMLSNSIKDDAELTMIVDLMRNDLSRVTGHDSVIVDEHKRIEPYENVFHLVSIVKGELERDKTSVDLIRATFPGGSITGCPKIRAMEIIDELESVKRHVYTGSIGYISFHDTMDLSIAIRTATIHDKRIWFSVGGGIVYDSDPLKEFQETLDKGKTLMDALSGRQKPIKRSTITAWANGKFIDSDKVMVHATSPGFQYGAGLFETIRADRGQIHRLEDHVNRLNQSWKQIFSGPAPDISWEAVIQHLIRKNRFEKKSLAVKLMVSKNGPGRGGEHFLAALMREYVQRPALSEKAGLDLVTYPHPRQTPLADQKTMNYLYYDLAGRYAKKNGADEALILNPDQSVSETNTANLIAVNGKTVLVPQSAHVLPGVTLNTVLNFLSEKGYEICRQPVFKETIYTHSNLILTNALMGAVKVLTVDKKRIHHDADLCCMLNQNLFGKP